MLFDLFAFLWCVMTAIMVYAVRDIILAAICVVMVFANVIAYFIFRRK